MKIRRNGLIVPIGVLAAFVSLALFSGCSGGGGATSSQSNGNVPGGDSGTVSPAVPTAKFTVDVTTGQVMVTPVSSSGVSTPEAGTTASPRAVFTGTSVSFNTSTLVDEPGGTTSGTTGLKVMSVSLTNNWGTTIGQMPDGTTTGLQVVFGPFANMTGVTDIRSNVQVTTVVGGNGAGTLDGPVSTAAFDRPLGIAADNAGAVYVSDYTQNRIRKIEGGYVSTLAGSDAAGSVDGAGTAATFNGLAGLAVNPVDGALIVAEGGGNRIRRVDRSGNVTLLAGTGSAGGTNGSGSVAQFATPYGVAVDASGAIYVVEYSGHRVRKVVLTGGADPRLPSSYTVSTLAGYGGAGYLDGVGTGAAFNAPRGVAVDDSGTVYVADTGNNRIRRVSATGEVVTIAGTGAFGGADGYGNQATFNLPMGICWMNGALAVSDFGGHTMRQVRLLPGMSAGQAMGWEVRTLAGLAGVTGYTDGTGTAARFHYPAMVAEDGSGNLYVCDYQLARIRLVRPAGGFFPVPVVGIGWSPTDNVYLGNPDGVVPGTSLGTNRPFVQYPGSLAAGATTAARKWAFCVPAGVTAFQFTVQVAANADVVVPVDAVDGRYTTPVGVGSPDVMVSTIAGTYTMAGFVDGPGAQALFGTPYLMAADVGGNVYVADWSNHSIRRINAAGVVTTVAGTSGTTGIAEGNGTTAQFFYPNAVAVTADGLVVYVADSANNKIRRISRAEGSDPTKPANWTVSTIAGTGVQAYIDGPGNLAQFYYPQGIAVDAGGNLYVTEGNRVRRMRLIGSDPSLASSWEVGLVAGNTTTPSGASGNTDQTGSAASFNSPNGIAVDPGGNLYVADRGNNRIRKITTPWASGGGTVSTLAGSTAGYLDNTIGTGAEFYYPYGVAVDASGYVYVADRYNDRIRRISSAGVVTTVAGGPWYGSLDGPGNVAQFNYPCGITVDPAGNLYVSEGARTIRKIQRIVDTGVQ